MTPLNHYFDKLLDTNCTSNQPLLFNWISRKEGNWPYPSDGGGGRNPNKWTKSTRWQICLHLVDISWNAHMIFPWFEIVSLGWNLNAVRPIHKDCSDYRGMCSMNTSYKILFDTFILFDRAQCILKRWWRLLIWVSIYLHWCSCWKRPGSME